MEKVFLAFAFRPEDRDLVANVETLLESYGVMVVTGDRVGGNQITPAVKTRIDDSDGLIALLTRRDQKADGTWTTHDWVKYELQHGRDQGKPAIALVEDGVEISGPYGEHERITLSREKPLDAFLSIAETIGLWKREGGRHLKVQILPEALASSLGSGTSNTRCRYRLCYRGTFTAWKEVEPVLEPGGTFLYLQGVCDEHMIQIEVFEQNKSWRSPATSQWMQVKLNLTGGN